jgi:prephenate dehydrogenase
MRKIGIIGLGLIGGSMAIDLRRRGFADEVLGVENDQVNAEGALRLGLADRIVSREECIALADILVLAVPVGTASVMLPEILDIFAAEGDRGRIVIDVCSTKRALAETVASHPMRRRYVATHPMAGTEYSGPWAAMPNLFDGKACIIADPDRSDPEAVATVETLYDALHMRVTQMDSASHDIHTAYVSHISHITSFALALTVLDKERDEKHIFDLASGGFSSTVRLAKSSPDMWVPILAQNRDNILRVMDTYIGKMQAFRDAIAEGDEARIRALIEEANHIRKILG